MRKETLDLSGAIVRPSPPPKKADKKKDPASDRNTSDKANAERWMRHTDGRFIFNHTENAWMIWDGRRWIRDERKEHRQAILDLSATVKREAMDLPTMDEQNARIKVAQRLEQVKNWDPLLTAAAASPDLAKVQGDFDRNGNLLNLRNGTLDLETFDFREHRRGDLITGMMNADYDEGAEFSFWLAFLNRIFRGDSELITFLQKIVGYSLSGKVSAQAMFFLYGTGKNGKSIFIESMMRLFGDYAVKLPVHVLMQNKFGNADRTENEVARLKGRRFAITSETEEGNRLSEATIKNLTGGDTLTARVLHGRTFEFPPTHKLWMFGNHKPTIRGTDAGIWRRILLIPFTVTIRKEEQRPSEEMLSAIMAEADGILQWSLDGLRAFTAEGLDPIPEAVRRATDEYKSDSDLIERFLSERCERTGDTSDETKSTALYRTFTEWMQDNGETARITRNAFTLKLKEKGIDHRDGKAREKVWQGLRVLDLPTKTRQAEATEFDEL